MESGIKSSLEESDKKYETAAWIEDLAASVKSFKIKSETDIHLKGIDERVTGYLEHRTSHFRVLQIQYKTIIAFKVIITLNLFKTFFRISTILLRNLRFLIRIPQ